MTSTPIDELAEVLRDLALDVSARVGHALAHDEAPPLDALRSLVSLALETETVRQELLELHDGHDVDGID